MYGVDPPLFDDENVSRKGWFYLLFNYVRSRTKIVTVTAAYTVAADVFYVRVDATGGAVTVTLPVAANMLGRQIAVKKIDSSGNAVTVGRSGSDVIDGATTKSLATQYTKTVVIAAASATWDVLV